MRFSTALATRALVSLLWLVSSGVAFVVGGELTPLTDLEITEGSREAQPLIDRFAWLRIFLAIIGFPLWLAKTIMSHAKSRERPPAQEQQKPAPPQRQQAAAPAVRLVPPMPAPPPEPEKPLTADDVARAATQKGNVPWSDESQPVKGS